MHFLVLGGILLTTGDIFFKFWLQNPKVWMYVAGLAIYLLGLMCLIESFKTKNIAIASAIFVIINLVTLSFASWIVFSEPLTTKQIFGIILSIAAIIFLE